MKLHKYYTSVSVLAYALLLMGCVTALEGTALEEKVQSTEQTKLKIEFVEPDSYTDIRPSNESRSKYQKHVLTSMKTYFTELSEALPEGQILEVKVTDIDLAGDTRSPRVPVGSVMFDVRVMEDIYFPRIKFSYALKNQAGDVLKSDEVNLKDMNYLTRGGVIRTNRRGPFPYEQLMLEGWFEETFGDQSSLP